MKKSKLIIIFLVLLFISCNQDYDRRIRLSSGPTNALMRDKVATIQIAAAKKKSIAIYHFLNKTGKESLNWLEHGIVEMLGSELGQSRQLNLTPTAKVSKTLDELGYSRNSVADTTLALNLAKNLNAEVFICGDYDINNDSLQIDLELRDGLNGQLIQKVTEKGGGLENVFVMVDRLSRSVRENLQLNFSDPGEIDKNIAKVSTRSVEAYKYFALGVENYDKFYLNEAEKYFKKAIELDSTFASAYHRLVTISSGYMDTDEIKSLLDKAVKYSENSPPRERLQILATKAVIEGNYYKAIEIYRQLTDMFPEDDEAHYQLGNYYFFFNNQVEKAIEQFEAAVALNPEHKLAYNVLGYAYADYGNLDYAYKSLQKYIELTGDEPNPYDSFGEVLHMQGEMDEAIVQYKKALKINKNFIPSLVHLANVYLDQGKYSKARKLAKKLIKDSANKKDKHQAMHLLARSYYFEGKIDKARQIVEKIQTEFPDNLYTMSLLMTLEDNEQKKQAYLHDWIKLNRNLSDTSSMSYDNLFAVIALCFKYEQCIEEADIFLNSFLEKQTDPFILQATFAFKQIIHFMGKSSDSVPFEMPLNPPFWAAFRETTNISWNIYWKYYFSSLKKAFQNQVVDKNYIHGAIDFSRDAENLFFEMNHSYALSYLELLDDNMQKAAETLQNTGTPFESKWKIFGPFQVRQGIHQKFWPENESAKELVEENNEKYLVFDDSEAVLDGYLDLKELTNARFNSSVYSLLPVYVPDNRTVELRLGPTGPVKVWLNDRLVLVKNVHSPAILDRIKTKINLSAGLNYLLIKSNNRIGELGFYFRITDENGYGYPDISFTKKDETVALVNVN
ncbi:tetratricopeptide repeat protein [candidate division KSB1 bacterium]|nr:tetratricopeptide repeat protein [candidate division KSB1 bacterium]